MGETPAYTRAPLPSPSTKWRVDHGGHAQGCCSSPPRPHSSRLTAAARRHPSSSHRLSATPGPAPHPRCPLTATAAPTARAVGVGGCHRRWWAHGPPGGLAFPKAEQVAPSRAPVLTGVRRRRRRQQQCP